MKQSFYEWCIKNNCIDFLQRWDNTLNQKSPQEVSASDIKKYYFLCENNEHDSSLHSLSDVTRHRKIPPCKICGSFGYWCEHNNRSDLLKRWDYEKNKISPYDISISSTKKKYFLCPRGIHESELKDLNNIRKQYGTGRCYQCDSIGQFGIDTIDINFVNRYWSDKNTKSPFEVNKNSPQKIWIKCNETTYHEDYDVMAVNFFKGKRCPYCSGRRVDKSDSLAVKYPEVLKIWSNKNKKSPYEYTIQSNKQVFWECPEGKHETYKRSICLSLKTSFNCPLCVRERKESFLQEKVRTYLESLFNVVLHEYNCTLLPRNPKTKYVLPYDNEIPDIKLIIEVNGQQHYSVNSYNNFRKTKMTKEEAFELRKRYDKFKMQYALDHGYSFLEIPYWTDDEKETWKILIDSKIKSIRKNK